MSQTTRNRKHHFVDLPPLEADEAGRQLMRQAREQAAALGHELSGWELHTIHRTGGAACVRCKASAMLDLGRSAYGASPLFGSALTRECPKRATEAEQ